MKLLIIVLVVAVGLSTCSKKDVQGDLVGDDYVRGRLFLYDTITRNERGTALAEKTVYIKYNDSNDTLNYLFSAKTDKDGYFIFTNLNGSRKYKVYFEEKISGVMYAAEKTVTPPIDTVRLIANLALNKQNGLHYTIEDPTGGRITKASICVFTNLTLFKPGSCDGSNFSLLLDSSGHAFKFNIPRGTYYVTIFTSANNILLTANDTVSIDQNIIFRNVRLQKPPGTGFKYVIADSTRSIVSGANVCIFTSQVLFSRDTCEGSNFQVTANTSGIAEKRDLDPGRYFIYGNLKFGNVIYFARDTLDITANNIVADTLILRRKYQ